jgi:protease-4
MTTFSDQVQARVLQAQLGDQYPLYQKVQKLKNYQGVQVRMPQDISIK